MHIDTTKVLTWLLGISILFFAGTCVYVLTKDGRSETEAQTLEQGSDSQAEGDSDTRDDGVTASSSAAQAASETKPKQPRYDTQVDGYSVALKKDGAVIQTITLEGLERSGAEFMVTNNLIESPFVTDEDINFDGHADLSAAVSYGYGGRSMYYNYYVFNPKTERFERDALLTEIVNPVFDAKDKAILSGEISGMYSYETIYSFNGTSYVKGETKATCMYDACSE